jgi:hypothetical protein
VRVNSTTTAVNGPSVSPAENPLWLRQPIENEYDHDYDYCRERGPNFAKALSGRLRTIEWLGITLAEMPNIEELSQIDVGWND